MAIIPPPALYLARQAFLDLTCKEKWEAMLTKLKLYSDSKTYLLWLQFLSKNWQTLITENGIEKIREIMYAN